MTDSSENRVPATETRGGENPGWARAKPGEPLPEKEQDAGDAA